MTDLSKTLRNARRRLIAELKRTFAPHMWDSGYQTGPDRRGSFDNSRPLKLWAPMDTYGKPKMIPFDGYALKEFWGFCENGIITDAYGGGCVTEPLTSFPLEDLLMLSKWAAKNVAAEPAGEQTRKVA